MANSQPYKRLLIFFTIIVLISVGMRCISNNQNNNLFLNLNSFEIEKDSSLIKQLWGIWVYDSMKLNESDNTYYKMLPKKYFIYRPNFDFFISDAPNPLYSTNDRYGLSHDTIFHYVVPRFKGGVPNFYNILKIIEISDSIMILKAVSDNKIKYYHKWKEKP